MSMKVEIDAVPVSTLDDIQKTIRNVNHDFFQREWGDERLRKGINKGIEVALDIIDFYKKGNELGWTEFLKWLEK